MSLVAYDDSDSSECENDGDESAVVTKTNVTVQSLISPILTKEIIDEEESVDQGLFKGLPRPSNKISDVIEEEDEFLHKKDTLNDIVRPKSKITVPSLSEFKDVEGTIPNAKPKAVNGVKKSGLLSMLPQPKNGSILASSKSMIPHMLLKKPSTSNVKKKETLPSPVKRPKVETNVTGNDYSDDSDDDGVENDFFSINKPLEEPLPEELPLDVDLSTQTDVDKNKESSTKKPRSIESYFKKDIVENNVLQPEYVEINNDQYDASSSVPVHNVATEDNILDDEAILKLVGARGKRKMEEIQIVDVNQQEVLAEARELLLKGLMDDTTKRVSSSKKKGNEPTNQQKRKHQITYLAHQAKANEAELQNKWANNRMSKRQTQSKYGF